jgi:hypothetical protein
LRYDCKIELFLANPALGQEVTDLPQRCQGRLVIIPKNGWIIVTCRDDETADSHLSPAPARGPGDDVPLCQKHDPTDWHPVYDADLECHYDHHHGRDPYDPEIVALLGDPDQLSGQGISYAWRTPQENELKHRAYWWNWQINDECLVFNPDNNLCVKAFRTEIHADAGIVGFNARFHSFYIEVMACDPSTFGTADENCGIVRRGGHYDSGFSYAGYFGPCVEVPANPGPIEECPDFKVSIPYRTLRPLDDLARTLNGRTRYDSNLLIWLGQQEGFGKIVFRIQDAWAGVNPEDWTDWQYACPDFQCRFNGSTIHIGDIVTEDWNAGSESGFTSRNGSTVSGCTEPGVDCVPYSLEDWPGGRAIYGRGTHFPDTHPQDPTPLHYMDFDQSPAAMGTGKEWWLVPTNHEPRP